VGDEKGKEDEEDKEEKKEDFFLFSVSV